MLWMAVLSAAYLPRGQLLCLLACTLARLGLTVLTLHSKNDLSGLLCPMGIESSFGTLGLWAKKQWH